MPSPIPFGQLGSAPMQKSFDPVYGNRRQWFTYELMDNDETPKGNLVGVTGGRVEFHSNAPVRGGGKITVQQQTRNDHNWLKRRIKIVMHIEGLPVTPLGVFIPSAPTERWDERSLQLEIDLLDKCSILDNEYISEPYTAGAGTKVSHLISGLVQMTGERPPSVADLDGVTLRDDMTWESGTDLLTIVNDILDAVNFFPLEVDGDGRFRVEKYRLPRDRPVAFDFKDNYESIYTPVITYEKDHWSVPNKVVLIGQGSAEEEAMVATATNNDASSPYSYQQRGRWITDVTKGVEAASLEILQEKAERQLVDLTTPTGSVSIDHAPLPGLGINSVVKFERIDADIWIRAVVESTQIDLNPTALQRTQLRETAVLGQFAGAPIEGTPQ